MDIVAELKLAAKEHMQQAWDEHLIESWTNYKNCNMPTCVSYFYKKYRSVDNNVFGTLRRIPKSKHHWHCCITRFVAAYLPKLSAVLFTGRLSKAEIVELLSKSKLDTQLKPEDNQKAVTEKREVAAAAKAHRAADMGVKRRREWRAATSRSNWNACK